MDGEEKRRKGKWTEGRGGIIKRRRSKERTEERREKGRGGV